jgi:hypothetical protein
MTSIADGSVKIQATSESNISTPAWFGEIVVISSYLQKHQFSPKSMSRCVLRGSVLAGMRSSIFWPSSSALRSVESVHWRSFTSGFSRLPSRSWRKFLRDRLPSRSALSRFLAALTEAPIAHELRNEVTEEIIPDMGKKIVEDGAGRSEDTREPEGEPMKRAKEKRNAGPSGKRGYRVPLGEAVVGGKEVAVRSQERRSSCC